jgi:hypothetical protein
MATRNNSFQAMPDSDRLPFTLDDRGNIQQTPENKALVLAVAELLASSSELSPIVLEIVRGATVSEAAEALSMDQLSAANLWQRASDLLRQKTRHILDQSNSSPHIELSPELKKWALKLHDESEIMAELADVRARGGPELGEVIRELERGINGTTEMHRAR